MGKLEEDTRARVIREHGRHAYDQANRECAELVGQILPLLTGRSNLAVGNALVTLVAALARADDLAPDLVVAGLREAFSSPHVIRLAANMRDAMAVRADA